MYIRNQTAQCSQCYATYFHDYVRQAEEGIPLLERLLYPLLLVALHHVPFLEAFPPFKRHPTFASLAHFRDIFLYIFKRG